MARSDLRRFSQIGVDRLIRLSWLQKTARLVLAGDDDETFKGYLQEYLRIEFPSSDTSVRGSINKIITILLRVWSRPPEDLVSLRNGGLELLVSMKGEEELPIHWGMTMAVYPFWGAVAAATGRLLSIQEDVSASQVQRRLREQYGERQTVSRRVRYLLRSFIDWGVLRETQEKGVYAQGRLIEIYGQTQKAWLLEALLNSLPDGTVRLSAAVSHRAIFPFELNHVSAEQITSSTDRIELVHQAAGQDLLILNAAN
ncbi:MAG: hypothetical protein IIA89_08255 [Chloroflexi bacterium]|nr:hypothetical protein [Chloroflexota bacterium]